MSILLLLVAMAAAVAVVVLLAHLIRCAIWYIKPVVLYVLAVALSAAQRARLRKQGFPRSRKKSCRVV